MSIYIYKPWFSKNQRAGFRYVTASLCQVFEKTGARGSLILKFSEKLDLEVVISRVLKKIKKMKQKVIIKKNLVLHTEHHFILGEKRGYEWP